METRNGVWHMGDHWLVVYQGRWRRCQTSEEAWRYYKAWRFNNPPRPWRTRAFVPKSKV